MKGTSINLNKVFLQLPWCVVLLLFSLIPALAQSQLDGLNSETEQLLTLQESLSATLLHVQETIQAEESDSIAKRNRLNELSNELDGNQLGRTELRTMYEDILKNWRAVVDEVISGETSAEVLPALELPSFREEQVDFAKKAGLEEQAANYKQTYLVTQKMFQEFEKLLERKEQLHKEEAYRRLVLVGQLRARLLRELDDIGGESPFKISDGYLEDLYREVRLVPYRPQALLVSAVKEIKDKASSGVEGVLALVQSLLVLTMFVLVPLLFVFSLRKLLAILEQGQRKSLRNYRQTKPSRVLIFLQWFRPYLPWLIMLLALKISSRIVAGTELEWLSEILPYFSYYFVYRLFRVVIDNNLVTINRLSNNKLTSELQTRIEKTSKYLGLFLLSAAYLLETTAAVVRRALFYRLTWDIVFLCTPLILAYAAYAWRREIRSALKSVAPVWLYQRLEKPLDSILALVLALPAALVVIISISFNRLKEEVLEVDTIKSLSAQLFRRKIESNVDEEHRAEKVVLSQDYKELFSLRALKDDKLFVHPSSKVLTKIQEQVALWEDEKSDERTIALYGEKGVGKSSLLNLIKVSSETFRCSLEHKILSGSGLIDFLNKNCGFDLDQEEDVYDQLHQFDKSLSSKRVIIIDDAQNLFLSFRKGFEAYRVFTSILTLKTQNILWVVSFNYYSWVYLNAISRGSQFFRKVYKLEPWGDEQIKALILKRHHISGYKLEFDSVIYSLETRYNREKLLYVQDRFFELLWEQSKGNPRTAIALWLTALKPAGKSRIVVGLPGGHLSSKIDGLTNDELFVIASIAKHECLTTGQATLVTGIDESQVQHALRVGVERGFLQRGEDSNYRVSALWHPIVTRELLGKNLIYG